MTVRVLIVDTKPDRSGRLEPALRAAGFIVLAVVSEDANLDDQVRQLQPDAIIIDSDCPTRDTLEHLAAINQRYPRPMVMFAEQGDTALTHAAAHAGVSAYIVEGISATLARSLIEVSILHFQGHSALQAELEKTRQTLDERQVLDRAKCQLMDLHGLTELEAYTCMRRAAMNRGQRLPDLARALLAGTLSL